MYIVEYTVKRKIDFHLYVCVCVYGVGFYRHEKCLFSHFA